MITLAVIYYMQEQNEPSCPEFIVLDDTEAVRGAVLQYLNDSVEGEWVESEDSFFGDECWQFESDEGLYCFVNRRYVTGGRVSDAESA